jgi:hypothetical protein
MNGECLLAWNSITASGCKVGVKGPRLSHEQTVFGHQLFCIYFVEELVTRYQTKTKYERLYELLTLHHEPAINALAF